MFDRYALFAGAFLTFALGACTPETDKAGERPDELSPSASPRHTEQAEPPRREIPVAEILQTNNEQDMRLVNALRAFIPMLMHAYGSPG